MRVIQARKNKTLAIGFQGENDAVKVEFDVTGWSDLYGAGTFIVMNQRPTENYGYPCNITTDGNKVTWTVSNADVYYQGNGRLQLVYTVNQVVAKSEQFFTRIDNAIGSGPVPDPAPDWVWEVREAIATIEVATIPEIEAALYS
jgi:hypothetical protein